MSDYSTNNVVLLEGYVDTEPELHHQAYGEGIYEMVVSVPRLNADVSDFLKVEVSERLIDITTLKKGIVVRINGQFRSFNKKDKDAKVHLRLSVFAKEITILDATTTDGVNQIHIDGYLCKDAKYRQTPKGREICDMLIAVHRSYGKSDYLPCIAWGRNARFTSNLDVGCGVSLEGRVQSRTYKKKISDTEMIERVAYEVSVSSVSVFKDSDEEAEEQ